MEKRKLKVQIKYKGFDRAKKATLHFIHISDKQSLEICVLPPAEQKKRSIGGNEGENGTFQVVFKS